MPSYSRVAGNERVDVSQFKRFATVLRKQAPDSAKRMRKGLRASAQVVADKTKGNASFSTRIPGSVGIRTSGVVVSVVAGGVKAPNAAPIENRGRGNVRHPVFKRDGRPVVWTDKNSREAWFAPAVHESMPAFTAAMVEVLDGTVNEVVREMGG